jgi:hypothetical protein
MSAARHRRSLLVVIGCFTAAAAIAAQGRQAAPARGGKVPEVIAGGIRVAKIVVPKDDMFARPFNAENGTTLLLWIRMPAGQGLIEIDEDASLLELFGDDKGTDLGGRFESFPDEFKDASGGMIEILSTGMPATGATRLTARGTLALSVASGIKPQRVASVRIENDRTFRLGQTTVTLAEVSTSGDELAFTLKLPRQIMEAIRDVRLFDAKNQPIEGRRTGTGYMNDAGEMGLSAKTALRTLTLEFDVWQGRQTIKVPFNVQAGIGLGGLP